MHGLMRWCAAALRRPVMAATPQCDGEDLRRPHERSTRERAAVGNAFTTGQLAIGRERQPYSVEDQRAA